MLQIIIIAGITLACGEIYVRHIGYAPTQVDNCEQPEGTMYRLTANYGQVHRPGYYKPSEGALTGERVWPNCQRSSRPLPLVKRPLYTVALQGCSWTYGLGASDNGTYAWRLNELYPNILFDNYGECEYGAHLVYRRMRDTIAHGKNYDLYIYAFIDDHLFRDLVNRWYLMEGNESIYYFPQYELHNPHRDYHLGTSYWWGEQYLALSKFFHLCYVHHQLTGGSEEDDRIGKDNYQAFRENVLAMRDLAQSRGSAFALLDLGANYFDVYETALADSGIAVEKALDTPDSQIYFNAKSDDPGDPNRQQTHPNDQGHAKIAEAVTALLKRQHLPAAVTATQPPLPNRHGYQSGP